MPEDLVLRAAELDLGAVALVDRNSLSGAPRFFKAARKAGIHPIVGAEIVIDEHLPVPGPPRLLPAPSPPGTPLPRITLLVEHQQGYRNLCRLLTEAARKRPKGIKFYRAKSVYVDSSHRVPVQSDGDIIDTTPVKFSIFPCVTFGSNEYLLICSSLTSE